MRYTAPANLLIASDDPNDVAALGAVVGYRKVDLKPTFASGGLEQDLHLKAQASRAAVFYVAPQNRIGFLFLPGFETSVFAHSRRASADSEERLVTVSVAHLSMGARYPNHRTLEVEAFAQRFAGYWPYQKAQWSAVARMHIKVGRDECFSVFAGQVDPDDPARFTIDYTLNGRSGVIDGRLQADDTIALTQSGAGRVVDP